MTAAPQGVAIDVADGVASLSSSGTPRPDWAAAVRGLAAEPAARVVVLQVAAAGSADEVDAAVHALAAAPQVVVGVLDGSVAGPDAALALGCDLRVMAAGASLRVEPWCGGGVSWTLPRVAGGGRAADLLLRPRAVAADEALALGLVTAVADDPHAEAARIATDLAGRPATAQTAVKRALAHAATHDLASSLDHEAQRRDLLARLGVGQA